MSNYIRKLTDDFCAKMGFELCRDCFGVVNNGEKQPASILSKVKREVYSGQIDFSLGKLNDLSRCALIVDSYSEVPKILQNLNKMYPELVGHVSRHSTGYIGLHLNFTVNNIPIEVQLSTPDAWLVKQASEYVYKRHRDFESEIPTRLKKIQKEKDYVKKDAMIANFKNNFISYKNDYREINNLFNKLHRTTDLYTYLPIIESMFLSYEIKQANSIKNHFDYDKILEQKLTNDDGLVNDSLVINNSQKINPITKEIQEQLVCNVKEVFEQISINKDKFELDSLQQLTYKVRQFYIDSTYKEFNNSNMESYWNNYQNFIMKNINKSVVKVVLLLNENYEKLTENSIKFLFQNNNEKSKIAESVIEPKQILSELKNIVNADKEIEHFVYD